MNATMKLLFTFLLFTVTSASWRQTDKLIADDANATNAEDAGRGFATSVALDGDFLVVGTPSDNTVGVTAGAAYLFQQDQEAGTYSQIRKITDGAPRDNFGRSVAMQGNFFAVGAPRRDGTNPDTGSVFVYKLDDENFSQELSVNSPEGSFFGSSIAIDLPYLVVGAPLENGIAFAGGAVYVYKLAPDESGFFNEVRIVPNDVAFNDLFGSDVGISGNVLVAGSTGVNNQIGAAYIYTTEDDGASWEMEARINGRSTSKGDQFGQAVDIEDGIVVVGALKNRSLPFPFNRFVAWLPDFLKKGYFSDDIGKAYVFAKRNGNWKQTDHLRPLISPHGRLFGTSVVIRNGRIIVGAPKGFRESGTRKEAGAVYVFAPLTRNRHKWRRGAQLTPKDIQDEDNFGISVDYSAGTLVVGANQEDEGNFNEGAAYVYVNRRQSE